MKMEISAIITAISMRGTGAVTVRAEENQPTAAVSGYVSLESGKYTLAGENKTPSIYIDNSENFAVTRAAQNLRADIEKVTGVTPLFITDDVNNNEVTLASYNTYANIKIKSIDLIGGTMTVNKTLFDKSGRGIIGVYNSDKTLAKVFLSSDTTSEQNNLLHFNDMTEYFTQTDISDKEIKGFLWETYANGQLSCVPMSEVLIYEHTTEPTEAPEETLQPTLKPTTEPTTKPTEAPEETLQPTTEPQWEKADVIIGTIGQSDAIDKLVSSGKIDVSDIAGKWECFKTQIVDDTLVIVGSDRRGTIYGIS